MARRIARMPCGAFAPALRDTPFLPGEGRAAEPLPFKRIIQPIADLMRSGAGGLRGSLEALLAHRALAIRENSISTQPRFTARTPHGTLELQCHASDMGVTVRLEMGQAHILGRELVLLGLKIPATMCTGLAGERVSRLADVPVLPDDVRIERARTLTNSTRLLLDLPEVEVFLDDVPWDHAEGTLWARAANRGS